MDNYKNGKSTKMFEQEQYVKDITCLNIFRYNSS